MKNMKGNIGDLAIAGLLTTIFFTFMILGIGGYARDNGIPLPGSTNTLYNQLSGNQMPTYLSNANSLANYTSSQSSSISNDPLTAAAKAIVGVINLPGYLTSLLLNFIGFIADSLVFVGVPTSLAIWVASSIILLILALIIISAFFIFPLIR